MTLKEILSKLPDTLDFGENTGGYRYFDLDSNIAYYRNALFPPQPPAILQGQTQEYSFQRIGVDMDKLTFHGTPEDRFYNLKRLLEWVEINCEYKETWKDKKVWKVKDK